MVALHLRRRLTVLALFVLSTICLYQIHRQNPDATKDYINKLRGDPDNEVYRPSPPPLRASPSPLRPSVPFLKASPSPLQASPSPVETPNIAGDGHTFLRQEVELMLDFAPKVDKLDNYNRTTKEDPPKTGTPEEMAEYLQVPLAAITEIKEKHALYLSHMADTLPSDLASGRGIVMTGGGKYFPVLLVAVKQLNTYNPDLPIEIFMADSSEYEPEICEHLFPKFNAKCRVLEDIYGPDLLARFDYKGYPLKVLALLASSFKEVYFTDSDSYPVSDLSKEFSVSPYKDTGLVLFPDYWEVTTSPIFYEVAGVKLGDRVRGDPDKPAKLADFEGAMHGYSIESGQFFVNKSKHVKLLLLALYYNLYGRLVYFPLISQGMHGEGDKDTFTAAASVLGNEVTVMERLAAMGIWFDKPKHNFKGYAMCHFHPSDRDKLGSKFQDQHRPPLLAIHANILKLNARLLLQDHEDQIFPHLRSFGPLSGSLIYENGKDWELELWSLVEWTVCDVAIKQGLVPKDWTEINLESYCRGVQDHVEWLRENTEVMNPENLPQPP